MNTVTGTNVHTEVIECVVRGRCISTMSLSTR